jgi:hypothetical protein
MKFSIGLTIFLYGFISVQAQNSFQWAHSLKAQWQSNKSHIQLDQAGNLLAFGSFSGKQDFNPHPSDTFFLSTAQFATNAFLIKLKPDQGLIWAKNINQIINSSSEIVSISEDNDKNIIATGIFTGKADFHTGPNPEDTLMFTSRGLRDAFILKLDSNGNFVWARQFAGTGNDYGRSVASDLDGNIFVSGIFDGIIDINPNPAVAQELTASGTNTIGMSVSDIYLCKLSPEGNLLWGQKIGGPATDWDGFMDIDSAGNSYLGGSFSGTVDFDPGTGVFNLGAGTGREVFLAKYTTTGNFVWARKTTNASTGRIFGVKVDHAGFPIAIGEFFLTPTDFDPSPDSVFILTSKGADDSFIWKLSPEGNFVWAKSFGSQGNDAINQIHINALNQLFVAGSFSNTVDFDPGPDSTKITSKGSNDAFGLSLEANGNFRWAVSFGGTGDDQGNAITVSSDSALYFNGGFNRTVDFNPDSCQFNMTAPANGLAFYVKLKDSSPCKRMSQVFVNSCTPYLFYGQLLSTSGLYFKTFPLACCDSIVTLYLNITPVSTEVTVSPTGLSAVATGSYQWLNCDQMFTPIPNAVGQIFQPNASGNYAVEVTAPGNCKDTSACIDFNILSTTPFHQKSEVSVYWDSDHGHWVVSDINGKAGKMDIQLFDFSGKRTNITIYSHGEKYFVDPRGDKGIFFLQIVNENGQVQRVKLPAF